MVGLSDDCKVPVGDRDVVEVGDLANIDFVGTMDGEEFEGGSGAGYDLLIGSGSFVPGFEEGVVDIESVKRGISLLPSRRIIMKRWPVRMWYLQLP